MRPEVRRTIVLRESRRLIHFVRRWRWRAIRQAMREVTERVRFPVDKRRRKP